MKGFARLDAAHMANDNMLRSVVISNALSIGGEWDNGRKITNGPFGRTVQLAGANPAEQAAEDAEMKSTFYPNAAGRT